MLIINSIFFIIEFKKNVNKNKTYADDMLIMTTQTAARRAQCSNVRGGGFNVDHPSRRGKASRMLVQF